LYYQQLKIALKFNLFLVNEMFLTTV